MKKSVYLLAFLLLLPISLALECGDTIRQDTVLDQDYGCDEGFLLNASLDCNGYRIFGFSEGDGLTIQQNDLRIDNCKINSFENGVVLDGFNNTFIENNNLDQNIVGIFVSDANDALIRNNNLTRSLNYGIFLQFIDGVVYQENNFVDNADDFEESREVREVEEEINETEEEPELIEEPVVEEVNITPEIETILTDEELLDLSLKLEYTDISQEEINDEIKNLKETLPNVEIKREFIYTKDSTKVVLTITPEKQFFKRVILSNASLYERVPKCFATLVDNIVFEESPQVINPDPLIKKAFPQLESQQEFSYTTGQVITEDCEELFKAILIADVTSYSSWGSDLFKIGPAFVIRTFPAETSLIVLGILFMITIGVRFKKAGDQVEEA